MKILRLRRRNWGIAVQIEEEARLIFSALLTVDFFASRADSRAVCSFPTGGTWVAGEARAMK
ncbi:MAG: hypothetical protein KJ749_10205, partial [Planctomycetes bacterium]|nr:hypothetical protein [Planctomycetota bacterium]